MNLQERLERMLAERRVHVNVDPDRAADYRSKLLHEELGDWLIEACGDDGLGTPEAMHDRDAWLVRIAGAVLYLLHPEDDLAHVDVNALPLPVRSQALRAGDVVPVPDWYDAGVVVHRKGDGTYKRKPRPDRG